jgi:hypothetical protein
LVLLCRWHHDWAESRRTFAEFLGLIVKHGITRPRDVPVFHHGRWVKLDDHGCVLPSDPPGPWPEGEPFTIPCDWERPGPWGFNA